MVEQIPSGEVFGDATATLGEAPKHTKVGHELCAYYEPRDGYGPFVCPHDQEAFGAFYSEDLLKEIKLVAHQLIGAIDKGKLDERALEDLRQLTV